MSSIQYFHIAFEVWGAIFCVIAIICIYATRHFEKETVWSLIGVLSVDAVINLSDAAAYYFRGNETILGYFMVRISNFLVFAGGLALIAVAYIHIGHMIEIRNDGNREKWPDKYVFGVTILAFIMLVASRIYGFYYAFDEHNRYYRLDTYWISVVLGELALLPMIYTTISYRKVFRRMESVALLMLEVLPLVALGLQIFVYGISLFNFANTVSIIFLVVVNEIAYATDTIEIEKKLTNERIRLYHSQIQPHFVYNCLTAIRSYIPKDSKARDILNEFTRFLRGSMDMIGESECVPASIEFDTVKSYLYIEKERMGEKLNVLSDISSVDFMLPPFTVQIMVENAIKHGIRMDVSGRGTLCIRSYTTDSENIIEVSDDGVGFEADRLEELIKSGDEHLHVGINNLRQRLKLMCNGYLDIKSAPGVGTKATVHIPLVK